MIWHYIISSLDFIFTSTKITEEFLYEPKDGFNTKVVLNGFLAILKIY